MNKFIRKNQKKLLAVFGVFLMISFVAMTGVSSRSMNSNKDVPMGTLQNGKVTLTAVEYNGYRSQWQYLKTKFFATQLATALGGVGSVNDELLTEAMTDPQVGMILQQSLSFVRQNPQLLGMVRQNPRLLQSLMREAMRDASPEMIAQMAMVAEAELTGEQIYGQLEIHESLFPLLAKEAELLGIGANPDRVKEILTAKGISRDSDPDGYDNATRALRTLLMVSGGGDLAARVAKSSSVEGSHILATERQELSLNLVEFPAGDFLKDAKEPTSAQAQEQFDKYKNVVAGGKGSIGYKFPNRLKYEAVEIKRDEVRKGIAPVFRDQAMEYYELHKDQGKFMTATTQPATALPDGITLNNVPTRRLKPFDEVKDEIVDTLTDIRVSELKEKVQEFALTTMRGDYDAYKAPRAGASRPASAPVSSLGVPYDSKEYLSALRDRIQKDFKVSVTIEREEGMQTPATLAESRLAKAGYSVPERGVTFAMLLGTRVAPFVSEAERNFPSGGIKPIAVWEPTPAMSDMAADVLIARVTMADPEHVPASVDEVKDKVVADLRQAEAYKLAKAAAQAAVDSANREPKWLVAIANEKGKPVIATGLFAPSRASNIPGYEVNSSSTSTFGLGVMKLLNLPARTGEAPRPAAATRPATKPTTQAAATTKPAGTRPAGTQTAAATKPVGAKPAGTQTAAATTRPSATAPAATSTAAAKTQPTTAASGAAVAFKGHPIGLIELPLEGKVVVAEVEQLKPLWSRDVEGLLEVDAAHQRQARLGTDLRMNWYAYPEVVQRTNFIPAEGRGERNIPRQNEPVDPLGME